MRAVRYAVWVENLEDEIHKPCRRYGMWMPQMAAYIVPNGTKKDRRSPDSTHILCLTAQLFTRCIDPIRKALPPGKFLF